VSLKHVLLPLKIKGLTLKNRVVRAAHGTNIGSGKLDERLIAYHLARAQGGVALTILETLGMHWSSPSGGFQLTADLVERYQKLMQAVEPHGMAVFQQLWHAGNTRLPRDGSPPWSCSDVPNIRNKTVPIPMTKAMIDEIVATFASTAALCEEGGLQGVEVHGAHSYLVQQFLSPLTNFRTDEYGGSFDNRMRFVLEVLRAIRTAVSPDFIVGIRLSTEEVPGGLTGADNAQLIRRLEAEGLIDFVDLSMGGYYNEPLMIGTMAEATGYELPSAEPAAEAATVPVVVAGRFRTLEEADQVIAQGHADMVAMVRAHIADPDLIRKTIEAGAEEVRPCIGCNHGCIGAPQEGSLPHLGCTVNPAVGKELEIGGNPPGHTGSKRRVLVIGGGPAGMEAARLAKLRGLDVVLAEAADRLGGAIDIARRAPRRYGIADITDWMQRQIYKLGVDIRMGTYVEVDDVDALSPDAVIVATGSSARMDGYQTVAPGERMQGVDQPHVISTLDLLSQPKADFGRRALVWDDVGHYEGIAACEFLIERGLEVTCVTGNISFAHRMEHSFTTLPALERLTRDGRFSILQRHKILKIARNDVSVCAVYNAHSFTVPADTVVLVSYNRPNREIADALVGKDYEVRVVGDANSPRYLILAIREGHMAGRTVLSEGIVKETTTGVIAHANQEGAGARSRAIHAR
jgi:2,4-dienoyl-CoA reductase-like NADH-dependent reductase (Old Yellow Enzyme family)